MEVTLGMVPLMIKPIYAFYSGPLLKGSNTGVPQTAVMGQTASQGEEPSSTHFTPLRKGWEISKGKQIHPRKRNLHPGNLR